LQGVSQGGYWVPRAVAFEKRIAAAIADPGVVDVSTSWTGSLPPALIALLNGRRKAEFDGFLTKALSPAMKANLDFQDDAIRILFLLRHLQGGIYVPLARRCRANHLSAANHGTCERNILATPVATAL
jgi:hypothetical protein